jgi:hypothetical protein
MSEAYSKIGAGHVKTTLKLGLRELREATLPFPQQIAQEEIGQHVALPEDVARQRQPEAPQPEPER